MRDSVQGKKKKKKKKKKKQALDDQTLEQSVLCCVREMQRVRVCDWE